MKQLFQSYRDGEIWLADVPVPVLKGPGVLVKTTHSVISSGTERLIAGLAKKNLLMKAVDRPDLAKKIIARMKTEGIKATLNKVDARLDTPAPMGYACAGEVIECSPGIDHVKPGDLVACGGAGYASHAEYNYVPAQLCVRIPEGVSPEHAAFTTIGAIALQGVRQADVRLGEHVCVIGLGLIGLLTGQLLKASGCKVMGIDLSEARCRLGMQMGLDSCVRSAAVRQADMFTNHTGMDAVIVTAATSSSEPLHTAAELCRKRAVIVSVGLTGLDVDRNTFYKKDLTLKMGVSYGPGRYDPDYEERGLDYPVEYVRWTEERNMAAFLDMLAMGRVNPERLISHTFSFEQALDAYRTLESDDALAIALQYSETAPEPEATVQSVKTAGSRPDQVRIGLVGAGSFASGVLLPAMSAMDDVQLVAACSESTPGLEMIRREYGVSQITTDKHAFLELPLDAVMIASRHDSHADWVRQCLAKGLAVFVEKPLAVSQPELDELKPYARRTGVCMVGYNRRYSPAVMSCLDMLSASDQPTAVSYIVNAGRIPAEHWVQHEKEGGGRIIGEVCHFVDVCEVCCGSPTIQVHAAAMQPYRGPEEPMDHTVITLRHANGSVSSIEYRTGDVTGLPKEQLEVFRGNTGVRINDYCEVSSITKKPNIKKMKQDKGHVEQWRRFVAAVKADLPVMPDLATGIHITEVTLAMLESIRTGKAVTLQT